VSSEINTVDTFCTGVHQNTDVFQVSHMISDPDPEHHGAIVVGYNTMYSRSMYTTIEDHRLFV
jgi:hypothetical protein